MVMTKASFVSCACAFAYGWVALLFILPSIAIADEKFSMADVIQKSGAPKYGLVCPISYRVCFQQCYDPYEEYCIEERIACPKGQFRCGNYGCYSPDEKSCLNTTTLRGAGVPILCGLGERLCEGRCYNPETHHCAKYEKWAWICPVGQELCGETKCYDPDQQVCVGGSYKAVCPLGQDVCDYSCYDPATGTCFNDTAKGRSYSWKDEVLCKLGEAACGVRCYNINATDEAGMRCTANGAICPLDQEGCNRRACYSPAAGETCHNYSRRRKRGLKCDVGHEVCGWECYDPEIETCFPESRNKICWKGREPCGTALCYWPHNETCYENQVGYGAHACPNELSVCGYKCYDPQENSCHEWHRTRVLCALHEQRCGRSCYDPTKQVCAGPGETLCNFDQEACGSICYGPNKGLACYDDQILCKNGKLGCGCKCYDPKKQTCNMIPNGIWFWSD